MLAMEEKFPFRLMISVIAGHNLPIADYTTSDPYVILTVGKKKIGRTKTIYKNHMHPIWDEHFLCNLLHTRTVLELRVWDEDQGKDDDIMGIVEIDLSKLIINEVTNKSFPVKYLSRFKSLTAEATLDLSVLLTRNERAVSIVSQQAIITAKRNMIRSEPNNPFNLIQKDFDWDSIPDSVRNTCIDFAVEGYYATLNKDILYDMLFDVNQLTSRSHRRSHLSDPINNPIRRHELKLLNGKKIYFNRSKPPQRHPPIEVDSIQINLSSDETKFVLIRLSNRFAMWTWAKWLLLANDVWCGAIQGKDLPSWVYQGEDRSSGLSVSFVSQGSVIAYTERTMSGRLSIRLDRPYELVCSSSSSSSSSGAGASNNGSSSNQELSISLKNMVSMVLSADSWLPRRSVVEIDLGEGDRFGDKDIGDANFEERSSMFKVRSMMGTVTGVVKGAKGVAMDTAAGVANTAVGAVKTVASGNPLLIMREAHGKVIDVGSQLANTLTSAPQSVFGKSNTFVVFKCEQQIQIINSTDIDKRVCIDCNSDDLNSISNAFWTGEGCEEDWCDGPVNRRQKGSSGSIINTNHGEDLLLPPKLGYPLSLDIFMVQGSEGMEKIVGQKSCPLKRLLEIKDNDVVHVDFDSRIELEVSIGRASRLAIPPDVIAGATGFSAMYAKCKLVDSDGHSHNRGSTVINSPALPVSTVPNWDWHKFVFNANDRIDKEAYVRIELVVERVPSNLFIGAVFIPFEYFHTLEHEYTFPVTRFRMPAAVYSFAAKRPLNLGELTVRLRKNIFTTQNKMKLDFRMMQKESNLFNNTWYAECISVGAIDAKEAPKECMTAAFLPEGIQLIEAGMVFESTGEVDCERERSESIDDFGTNASVDSLALTDAWSTVSGMTGSGASGPSHEHEIVIFQNQRRTPYPPFDWSSSAYTRSNFSDLNFRTSYKIDDVFETVPPEGWAWVGDWRLDKSYTQTDSDGWCYGFTFRSILHNYKQQCSYTKPVNAYARRRKWVRKVRRTTDNNSGTLGEGAEWFQVMKLFEKANDHKHGSKQSKQIISRTTASPVPKRDAVGSAAPANSSRRTSVPVTISVPPAMGYSDGWRKDRLTKSPHAILGTCREKKDAVAPIFIPWEQVRFHSVITSSVISLVCKIDRFFALSSSNDVTSPGTGVFKPAEVEIFLSNVPAKELAALIEERKLFYPSHLAIQDLVQSGNMFALKRGDQLAQLDLSANVDDSIPTTVELSKGSQTMAWIDHQIVSIENRFPALEILISKNNHQSDDALLERSILVRRLCRLKLYLAALIGAQLDGEHNYNAEEVRAIMESDFRRAGNISLDNEVATAINRIDYLLDMAEKRLRDAALCGWKFQGPALQRALEILANGYFIEVVSILGVFFEDLGQQQAKGLTSKVELIRTYLKHHDRLDVILQSAIRPYGLIAQPPARLSLFLDLSILLAWYSSVLTLEMRARVDSVLDVWKDVSKDVTGRASLYHYPLPWLPQRISSTLSKKDHRREAGQDSEDGFFCTNIPEDLVEVLRTYLTHARVGQDSLATSLQFSDALTILDSQVCMAYSQAFLYLSEAYQRALSDPRSNSPRSASGVGSERVVAAGAKEWLGMVEEEEFSEYLTFLASVANDAYRVYTTNLINFDDIGAQDDVLATLDVHNALDRSRYCFSVIYLQALDQIACLVCFFTFHDASRGGYLIDSGLASSYIQASLSPNRQDQEKSNILRSLVEDILSYGREYEQFLVPACYGQLKQAIALRVAFLILVIIRDAALLGGVYSTNHPFILVLCEDINWARAKLESWLFNVGSSPNLSAVVAFLTCAVVLLQSELSSPELDKAITILKQQLNENRLNQEDRQAYVSGIHTCLALRGVAKFFSPEQVKALQKEQRSLKTRRNSLRPPPNDIPPANNANPSGKERRASGIMSFLGQHLYSSQLPPTPKNSNSTMPPLEPVDSGLENLQMADNGSPDRDEMGMVSALMEQRDLAVVACIESDIEQILSSSTSLSSPSSASRDLDGISVITRLFGPKALSLKALLVQSQAKPTGGQDVSIATTSQIITAPVSAVSQMLNKVFPLSGLRSPVAGNELKEDASTILSVGQILVEDLFYVDFLRAPKPYLIFRFGGVQARSSSKDISPSSAVDWLEEVVELPLHDSRLQTAVTELEVWLHYEGLLSSPAIAVLRVPLNVQLGLMWANTKSFTFSEFTDKAQPVVKKIQSEGRTLPSISFALSVRSAGK